jgi:hypothetical protein
MPTVRNIHETIVHRRTEVIHVESSRRVTSAAMAKANGTDSPTYPRYSSGGWLCM